MQEKEEIKTGTIIIQRKECGGKRNGRTRNKTCLKSMAGINIAAADNKFYPFFSSFFSLFLVSYQVGMENKCQKDLVSSFPRIWTHIRTLVIYQCFFFLLPFVGLSSFVLFYFLLNATILFLFRLVYFCRNNSKALANFLSVRKYTQMTNSGSSSAF